MLTLDFLNKNMYRKYPLRASCNTVFTNGTQLSNSLITSMQISSILDYLDLFVSKIHVSKNFISVTICRYSDELTVGTFSGTVLTDFDVVPLFSDFNFISGSLTIGTLEVLNSLNKGTYHIRDKVNNKGLKDNGLIEASCIFCYTPPAVKSITIGAKKIIGKITTSTGENLKKQITDNTTTLSTTNKLAIQAGNEFFGGINSCPTPIIKKINTVFPDEEGNIDVYGILPIVINVDSGEIGLTSGLDLLDVCPERAKISPPVNNSDEYYTNILEATEPEWKQWPNFS